MVVCPVLVPSRKPVQQMHDGSSLDLKQIEKRGFRVSSSGTSLGTRQSTVLAFMALCRGSLLKSVRSGFVHQAC